jgi:ketosteroid isomerase-like protein
MSCGENVEVVRRVYDAWNAGDMTALRDLCDPDVVMHHPKGWPEPGPSVGREAVLRERKIIDIDIRWDHAEALEGVGLRE